jgi:hypothetical protein
VYVTEILKSYLSLLEVIFCPGLNLMKVFLMLESYELTLLLQGLKLVFQCIDLHA